jgi:hypothetical protein
MVLNELPPRQLVRVEGEGREGCSLAFQVLDQFPVLCKLGTTSSNGAHCTNTLVTLAGVTQSNDTRRRLQGKGLCIFLTYSVHERGPYIRIYNLAYIRLLTNGIRMKREGQMDKTRKDTLGAIGAKPGSSLLGRSRVRALELGSVT